MGLLMREKKEFARKICETYETGNYTIEDCCKGQGIPYRTFMEWVDRVAAIAGVYKKSKIDRVKAFKRKLEVKAKSSLERLVEGEEYDEITREAVVDKNGKVVPGRQRVKTVHKKILPNPTAVIFALKNVDPENFKDRIHNEITGLDGGAVEIDARFTGIADKVYGKEK